MAVISDTAAGDRLQGAPQGARDLNGAALQLGGARTPASADGPADEVPGFSAPVYRLAVSSSFKVR